MLKSPRTTSISRLYSICSNSVMKPGIVLDWFLQIPKNKINVLPHLLSWILQILICWLKGSSHAGPFGYGSWYTLPNSCICLCCDLVLSYKCMGVSFLLFLHPNYEEGVVFLWKPWHHCSLYLHHCLCQYCAFEET